MVLCAELRGLKVGEACPLGFQARAHHQTLLQAIVAIRLTAIMAQRVGKQPCDHRKGRKRSDDAEVVDRFPAKGNERRLQAYQKMTRHLRSRPCLS